MKWEELNEASQLDKIDSESQTMPVLIFKHSTRCGISGTALNRFERDWKETDNLKVKPYYLDLIKHRDISNEIANRYKIEHQSPQILLISKGKCVYSQSHLLIRLSEILSNS